MVLCVLLRGSAGRLLYTVHNPADIIQQSTNVRDADAPKLLRLLHLLRNL